MKNKILSVPLLFILSLTLLVSPSARAASDGKNDLDAEKMTLIANITCQTAVKDLVVSYEKTQKGISDKLKTSDKEEKKKIVRELKNENKVFKANMLEAVKPWTSKNSKVISKMKGHTWTDKELQAICLKAKEICPQHITDLNDLAFTVGHVSLLLSEL